MGFPEQRNLYYRKTWGRLELGVGRNFKDSSMSRALTRKGYFLF